jgi:hypothetical protein
VGLLISSAAERRSSTLASQTRRIVGRISSKTLLWTTSLHFYWNVEVVGTNRAILGLLM